MDGRRLFVSCAISALFIGAPVVVSAQQPGNPGLDTPGFKENRDYLSQFPFEHIDTVSGALILTFTDLVLPGNAGRELRFQRTYNSKQGGLWRFGLSGYALVIKVPDPPDGNPPAPSDLPPILDRVDGGASAMAWYSGTSPGPFDAISRDFWRFDRSSGTLRIPNGDVCQYGGSSGLHDDARRVQSCVDAFGNVIQFSWNLNAPSPTLIVTQQLSASTGRQITVTLSDSSGSDAASIEYQGRTWTYSRTAANPPEGPGGPISPGWLFSYDGNELTSVITPTGGEIDYFYDRVSYTGPTGPPDEYWTRAVLNRTLRDREGMELGAWDYEYSFNPNAASGVTTVTTPSGHRVVYTHGAATGTTPTALFDGGANLAVLSRDVQRSNGQGGWVSVDLEQRTYEYVPVFPIMGTEELKTVAITREEGATPYVTTYTYAPTNSGDYHRPSVIVETGPAATRTTSRTYRHCPAPDCLNLYRAGLPLTETVAVGAENFSKSWTYDDKGFTTTETIFGIRTVFEKSAQGSVASSRTAMNKLTKYTYDFGAVAKIETPHHTTTREINPDGTVHSETQAGRTTVLEYDALGRLESAQPSGANATLNTYDTDGEWVRTERAPSANAPFPRTTSRLDAFGRVIRVEQVVDRVGQAEVEVLTLTEYDAEGRVTKRSHPHLEGAPNTPKWTEFKYDALGRLKEAKHPDAKLSTRGYGVDGDVTVVDERGKQTIQVWRAVGNPDQPRLVGLQDAHGKYWDYTYNALGNLTSVVSQAEAGGPSSLTRSWTYNTSNLLETESHPELGSTSQQGSVTFAYDVAGQLIRKIDAKGKYTYFEYDGNDRVSRITADGRATIITYEPGSDNRTSAMNAFEAAFWLYDQAGRLQSRRDSIDGKMFTTTFEYDDFDTLRTIQHPSGRRIQNDVNAAGQPTRIFEAAAGRDYASNITYHPSGGVESYLSNGVTTSIGYDPDRYWIKSIDSGDLQLTYAYDGVGNPQSITDDTRPSYTQNFAYDDLNRLIDAAGVYPAINYGYNLHGNRTGGGYQYEANKLRLSNQGGVSFAYDFNGNTVTAGTATFTYTPQNQVETAATPGVLTTYAYDSDDQRVKKTSGTTTSYFVRGGAGQLLTEWSNPGTASGRARDYIYLGTRLLSAVARNRTDDPAGGVPPPPSTLSHRFATSWQSPTGNGDNVTLTGGITGAARKTFHPDMPSTGLRLGWQNSNVGTIANGPLFPNNDPNSPKQGGVFFEFEIERRPFSSDGEWLGTTGGYNSTHDLRLYITPAGALVVKHDDGRGTPLTLYTSAPIELHTAHTVELRFEYNSYPGPYALPNPLWENLTSHAEIFFDGAQVATYGATPGGSYNNSEISPLGLDLKTGLGAVGPIILKSPGPANGLLMNVFRAGLTSAQGHGDTLGQYGNTWRTTLLQVAGPGTYSQWTGGQPDWRAHSAVHFQIGSLNTVQTTAPNQKISYLMESMVARGITGNLGVVMVGIRNAYATPGSQAFIRRNGVDIMLPGLTLPSNTNAGMRWYRVSEGGWLPSDTIEVGMVSGGSTGNSWLTSVAVMVEHNTPEPDPLTDTSARVVTVSYSGNGTGQTINLGVNMVPTALLVVPSAGAQGVEPLIWWDGRQGAQGFADASASFGRVWPQKGKLEVVHPTAGDSYNANGVGYTVIAVFDPSGRYIIPFGVSKHWEEDDYIHQLRFPQSGELAANFTPDFVFGGGSSTTGGDSAHTTFYKGPGHAGDLTAKLGVAQAADADRIQSMAAGQVQFGTSIGSQWGDTSFFAGRVNDGVAPERLMAVTSYVGDGTSSRNIPLALNGLSPVFALVMPTTAVAKVYRVSTDTTGRQSSTANAVANSITALGVNQITVGSALNAAGVTYDVWAITTGAVTPW